MEYNNSNANVNQKEELPQNIPDIDDGNEDYTSPENLTEENLNLETSFKHLSRYSEEINGHVI